MRRLTSMTEPADPSPPRLERHLLGELFPRLAEGSDELAALVEDIRVGGQLDKIVLFEGKVLDGWNRYVACLAAGKEPRFFLRRVLLRVGHPKKRLTTCGRKTGRDDI